MSLFLRMTYVDLTRRRTFHVSYSHQFTEMHAHATSITEPKWKSCLSSA